MQKAMWRSGLLILLGSLCFGGWELLPPVLAQSRAARQAATPNPDANLGSELQAAIQARNWPYAMSLVNRIEVRHPERAQEMAGYRQRFLELAQQEGLLPAADAVLVTYQVTGEGDAEITIDTEFASQAASIPNQVTLPWQLTMAAFYGQPLDLQVTAAAVVSAEILVAGLPVCARRSAQPRCRVGGEAGAPWPDLAAVVEAQAAATMPLDIDDFGLLKGTSF